MRQQLIEKEKTMGSTLLVREPMPAFSVTLPEDARKMLFSASKAGNPLNPAGTDFQRTKKIEHATAVIMHKYPEFFRNDG
jgi:hypothetical protein